MTTDLIDCMMVSELKRKLSEEKEQKKITSALNEYMVFLKNEGYCSTTSDISKELCRITIKALMKFSKEFKTPLYYQE